MATNAELLAQAKAAYHDLMIGQSARVVVDQNGERVEYTAANAARLAAYIQYLENLITPKTVRGPAGVIF
jgi:hypothetical protein